jgi:hypothetical protein
MTSFREDFISESFKAGRNRWHARIRRANSRPFIITGVGFPHLEVGSARPDGTAAIGDAQTSIGRFEPRASHSDIFGIQHATIA